MKSYYILVTGDTEEVAPVFFLYTTDDNDLPGVYTAYSRDEWTQQYWSEWLMRIYFLPNRFRYRFGYMNVRMGVVEDDAHLNELLNGLGVKGKFALKDHPTDPNSQIDARWHTDYDSWHGNDDLEDELAEFLIKQNPTSSSEDSTEE